MYLAYIVSPTLWLLLVPYTIIFHNGAFANLITELNAGGSPVYYGIASVYANGNIYVYAGATLTL